MINFWKKNLDNNEILKSVNISLKKKSITEGFFSKKLKAELSKLLKVKYITLCPNGTMALYLALSSLKLKSNDEVIIPNRSWISTAHVLIKMNLKCKIVEVEKHRPIMDLNKLNKIITKKTKAIIAVHMGGRACDMVKLKSIAKKNNIKIIEDAAQAFGSKQNGRYLGAQSDISCFSFSMAKTITSGQGGFVATNSKRLFKIIELEKNHGVIDTQDISRWVRPGLNFKFTDIQACIALSELKRFKTYLKSLVNLYKLYFKKLNQSKDFYIIPVNVKSGELPQYIEVIAKKRDKLVNFLIKSKIFTRKFYPNMNSANYLKVENNNRNFNDDYSRYGLYLPSGTNQNTKDIKKVITKINEFNKKKN
jgi:perosamine synthetase